MEKNLHVALVADENYAEFVATVIVSLFKTNIDFEYITIHLLSNKVSSNIISIISSHIPKNRGDLYVYDISNISEMLEISVPNNMSISTYGRLFLPSIIDVSIDKILYLDCDIIINNTLSDFISIDLKQNYIAGVIDTVKDDAKNCIGVSNDEPYLNGGVLLISLKNWRKDDIERKSIDFLITHNGVVVHNDQGIINAVCCGHKTIVHPKYNVTTNYFTHSYKLLNCTHPFYTEKEIDEAKQNPFIIHYTTGVLNRPWIKNSKHPLVSNFLKIRELTYWKDVLLREDDRSLALKILAFSFNKFPYPIYKYIQAVISFIKYIINK
jgi:lipopolysaccharide biosynthesis glycosyltransferase